MLSMCKDVRSNSVSIRWNTGTIGEWRSTQKRAQRVPLTQTIEYAHIYAKLYGFYPRLGLIYRNNTLIGFVQVLERRILRVIRITRIIRGPVYFDSSLGIATLSDLFVEIRREFPLGLLKWLNINPELEESENHIALLKSCGFVRAGDGNQVTWVRLGHINNIVTKMVEHQALNTANLNRIDDNGIESDILFAFSRITTHHKLLLRRAHLSLDILKALVSMTFASRQLIVSAQRINSYDTPELVAIIVACQHGQSASVLFNWHNSELNGARSYVTLLDAVFSDMRRRDIQWVDFSYSTILDEVLELSEGRTSCNNYQTIGTFV